MTSSECAAAPEASYLINSPAGVEHVLVSGAARYDKSTSSNEMFRTAVADGLLTLEGERWRRERRLVQPFFRSLGPSALGPAVSASLALLAARWEALAGSGEPTDLAHDMLALALGFTAQMLFSMELGDRADELAVSLERALRLLTAPSEPEFRNARESVHSLIESLIDRRRREPEARSDLLSVLMSASRDGDRSAGDPSLLDQIITYLLAGAETTGSALAWTLFLISAHPAERDRLEREPAGTRIGGSGVACAFTRPGGSSGGGRSTTTGSVELTSSPARRWRSVRTRCTVIPVTGPRPTNSTRSASTPLARRGRSAFHTSRSEPARARASARSWRWPRRRASSPASCSDSGSPRWRSPSRRGVSCSARTAACR